MDSPKVAIVVPAYNEERFIGTLLPQLRNYTDWLIVVDDGSCDDTARIAGYAGAYVIRHPFNLGKGAALTTGLSFARQLNPCAVVLIDGDGQHLPEQIPLLLEPILTGEADLVIGSRYLTPCSQVPPDRRLGHYLLNALLGLTSGISLTDTQSGYRALSQRALAQDLFLSKGFPVETEMQFWAQEHHLRVKEIPITVRYPHPPKRSPWLQGLAVLCGLLRLLRRYRPMFFFCTVSFAFLLITTSACVNTFNLYSLTGKMEPVSILILLLSGMLGFITLSTGIILHFVRALLFDMLHPHLRDIDHK